MRGSETGGETNRSLVAAEGAVGEKGVIVPMGGPPSEYRRPSLYSFDRSRGEGPRLLRRVRQRKNATIANASPPTTPPTTPPTIGATGVLDDDDEEGSGVAELIGTDPVGLLPMELDDVVSLTVVDGQCVKVLLLLTEKLFSIVSFVKTLYAHVEKTKK